MTSVLCRRRGGLLYLTCSCLLLAFCFFTSVLKPSGLRQSRSLEVYPWQMIDYDDYDCGCSRSGPPIVRESEQSMCSDWSTSRGLGQKVVSYSLFGNINKTIIYNKYFSAFEDRLKEVEKYYKGWTVRLYHNLSRSDVTSQKYLCRLYCQYPHLDLCQVDNLFPPKGQNADNSGHSNDSSATLSEAPKLPGTIGAIAMARLKAAASFGIHESYEKRLVGRMWRFITMADPLVSEFLVRDVDSSVLPREVAAVQQWLHNSTALLHVMRDHPSHNGVILAGQRRNKQNLILSTPLNKKSPNSKRPTTSSASHANSLFSGMWGGSRDRGGDFLKELLAKMVRWPPRNIWDYDQILLKRVVWPEVLDDVLVHDSYFCANPNFRSHHRAAPFPTRRHERYFVGWGPLRDHELAGITPCPLECRPPMHQDWTYC
ncbi:uncharacterized protein LOC134784635 [Penaeus indicus]|uniref:uncharacterized protein LOC134784635 n=1 Tax=Penaeus indicus TaxID=29960 RepID=UPI00300D2B33